MKINIPLQSYPVKSRRQNSQRLINMYPVQDTAGGKTDIALYPTPGCQLFGDCSGSTIRQNGMLEHRGVLYVCCDNKFGTVSSSGTFTQIGTLPNSSGAVQMAAIFDEIIIATGSTARHYKISTTTYSTITDVDFPTSVTHVSAQDEYFIALNPNTDEFYVSDLANGLSWTSTQFGAAEVRPDPLVSSITLFTELWLLGRDTTEIWFNTGGTFPFERQEGSFVNYGCVAPQSVVVANNTLYWLGRTRNGHNMVLTAEGQNPRVITTDAMHYEFDTYSTTTDAFAFTYYQEGHEFYI